MAADSETPFWDFSLAVYNRPGVAEACLALQDRRGLDVNLLLACCWAGAAGRRLEAQDISGLRGAVDEWQREVVAPLRAVRRRLNGPGDAAGGETAALLARHYAFAAVDRARSLATEGLRRIPDGAEARARLATYLPDHGVDLIALRRQVAEHSYRADGYPL